MNIIQKIQSFFSTKNVEVAGRWQGYYGYGQQYSKDVQKRKVGFIASITIAKIGGIEGFIKEDETGIQELASIAGQIKGIELVFTKTYLKSYSIDENANRYVSEGPHNVIYTGFYDSSADKFQGRWKIESIHILKNGKELEHHSTGYWEMTREID